MKTQVFVRRDVLDDLLGVFGEDRVREMLVEYERVVVE